MMRLGLIAAAMVLILDQITKWLVLDFVMRPPRVIEVTSFFNFVMVWNQGVSFGMFAHEAEFVRWALIAVSLAITAFLFNWLRKADKPLVALALGMVIGGAIGNVIDRLRFGAVADFLDFHVLGYHWPAFNVADAGISVGVVLLIYDSLFGRRDEAETAK